MAIDTILVAVGRGGEDAARTERLAAAVADLAVPTDAEVILLHVFGEDEYEDLVDRLDFDHPGDATTDDVARRDSATRRLGDTLEAENVTYEVRGEVSDEPGPAIVAVAEDVGADHVVVGGRKRSPAGKVVFGSTSQHVLLNADVPVTYVRAD